MIWQGCAGLKTTSLLLGSFGLVCLLETLLRQFGRHFISSLAATLFIAFVYLAAQPPTSLFL